LRGFFGEVVVDCVVDRGWLMVVCAAWKISNFLKYFCGNSPVSLRGSWGGFGFCRISIWEFIGG